MDQSATMEAPRSATMTAAAPVWPPKQMKAHYIGSNQKEHLAACVQVAQGLSFQGPASTCVSRTNNFGCALLCSCRTVDERHSNG